MTRLRFHLVTAAWLIWLAGATPGAAQEAGSPTPSARADALVRAAMSEYRLPSLSVAVARSGRVLFAAAHGLADVENSVPASPRTVYRLGSVTKPFTAALALKLAEDGRLDLDAPVEASCAAFPPQPHPVTVRRLLAHLGGIRHYDYRRFDEDFLNRKSFASLTDAVGKFSADPLVGEPGSEFHYSSWGYVLVGCALEGATGGDYEALLRRELLAPLGLGAMRLDRPSPIVPHRARGYSAADDGTWNNAVFFDASDRYPAAGLLGTPTELVEFADALLAGRVLGAASLELMLAEQRTSGGETTGAGLGWSLAADGAEAFHGGTSVGATSFLFLLPAERVSVALVTNLSLWTEPRLELARALAGLFTPAGGEPAAVR